MSNEMMYGEKLSNLSTALKLSADIVTDLVMSGYKADDLVALNKFVDDLTGAMQSLTKLVQDQALMLETQKILKGDN